MANCVIYNTKMVTGIINESLEIEIKIKKKIKRVIYYYLYLFCELKIKYVHPSSNIFFLMHLNKKEMSGYTKQNLQFRYISLFIVNHHQALIW